MTKHVAVIGGGPAGLMAAEVMAGAGLAVTVYDRMPSLGRKLLIAGRGGLNLTHSEPEERLLGRYGAARAVLEPAVRAFSPADLRAWCEGLGQTTFVGSSGRVFPTVMKASPLLRAWLRRLDGMGVRVALRQRWLGWDSEGALRFSGPEGEHSARADATVLALGGASWPRLGSDGAWTEILSGRGVAVSPLAPANGGFAVAWSEVFRNRFAGAPLKRIAVTFGGVTVRGEAVVTADGIEGGAIYALSSALRAAIAAGGPALARLDLRPDISIEDLAKRLAATRARETLSNRLRKAAALPPVAIGLVREAGAPPDMPGALAARIKTIPLVLTAPMPIGRAISSAGGIGLGELNECLMIRALPGVFTAGEMLNWEAPTGGYLLQASLATGAAAGRGVVAWLTGSAGR